MRNSLLLAASLALTVICWGIYGPVLHHGQIGMSTDGTIARLRPFVCVGIAYFLVAVIVPILWLRMRGEEGDWTLTGIVWSLAGGALGAIGSLGIILAFTFGGRPIYVMPLVFGGAPVVNAFLTIYLARRMREIGPVFIAGLIMVILGAITVLVFAPHASASGGSAPGKLIDWVWRLLAVGLTIVSWGSYGPVLHKGQAAMHHSRMRPLLCVGLAYFAIAVVVPYFFLGEMGENSTYRSLGTLWAVGGGMVTALGAVGIIMAFNSGGRPVFVMPLVFGGAPVINTLFTTAMQGLLGQVNALFLAGLILVIAGAVLVLTFAPRGDGGAAAAHAREEPPRQKREPEDVSEVSGEPLARD